MCSPATTATIQAAAPSHSPPQVLQTLEKRYGPRWQEEHLLVFCAEVLPVLDVVRGLRGLLHQFARKLVTM